MNTATQAPTTCPATGRSASVCIDQSHAACYSAHRESVELDRKVEREMRRTDPTY